MKDIILKELFWFVLSFVISLFTAFLFLFFLKLTTSEASVNAVEKTFTVQLYIIGCLVSIVSIYIIRIIVKAIKKYL